MTNKTVFGWKFSFSLLTLLGLFNVSIQAFAEQQDPNKTEGFFEMSLEELMDVPIVVSTSRQGGQKSNEVSAAVSVITAEDIHYSGATSIPEILQFSPAVDVRRIDRRRYIVGIRGLSGIYSDRTLILINGIPAVDIVYGTTRWEDFPIMIEDIERIEIVRGPGGAAWGANATMGVINIITKEPEDVLGYFGSTTINEFGDTYTHLRVAKKQDKLAWRISTSYEDMEDSDSAGAGKYFSGNPSKNATMGFDSFSARDWARAWKVDSEFIYTADEQTKWSFGAGYSYDEQGDYEVTGVFPRRDFLTSYTRLFSRVDHEFDTDTTGHLQWFCNYWDTHRRARIDNYTYMENDIEGQLNFKVAQEHTLSIGGNLRWNHITSDYVSLVNETRFNEPSYDEYWAGLFFVDRWKVNDRLTLEGQIRVDRYSVTNKDWSMRLSMLYALDDEHDHMMRFSFARSFRSPNIGLREIYADIGVSVVGNPQLRNEGTYSFEAGYSGKLSDHLRLNLDGYYQRFERLSGIIMNSTTTPPFAEIGFENIDGANAYGGEVSLTYSLQKAMLKVWYGYNGFTTDQYAQDTRSITPAKNKAGLTGRFTLDDNWTFNTNYTFQDKIETYGNTFIDLRKFHRLDLTLSRKFADGKGEFMFGVADLLNGTTDPVLPTSAYTGLETPGRMFFTRLQMKF